MYQTLAIMIQQKKKPKKRKKARMNCNCRAQLIQVQSEFNPAKIEFAPFFSCGQVAD
jgi:hypothetical protein